MTPGFDRIPSEPLKSLSEKSKEKLYLMIKDICERDMIFVDVSRAVMPTSIPKNRVLSYMKNIASKPTEPHSEGFKKDYT